MDYFSSLFPASSLDELVTPVSLLVFLSIVIAYYVLFPSREPERPEDDGSNYTPVEKRDMTVSELLEYNGTDPSKAILLAVCGKIYDVTRGRDFYGPGGPYAVLAGHDATRALATMDATANGVKDTDDDYSDLSPSELSQAQEWAQTLAYKYDLIGKLLKASDVKKEEKLAEKCDPASEAKQVEAEEKTEASAESAQPAEAKQVEAENKAEESTQLAEDKQIEEEEKREESAESAQPAEAKRVEAEEKTEESAELAQPAEAKQVEAEEKRKESAQPAEAKQVEAEEKTEEAAESAQPAEAKQVEAEEKTEEAAESAQPAELSK